MRLGEIRNLIDEVADDNKNIIIDSESLFGDQAYNLSNYSKLIRLLVVLSDQDWNDADYTVVEELKNKYGEAVKVQVTQDEYGRLNSYISLLNQKIPLFYSILETMVEEQQEQTINIKLPERINSIVELNKFNKELVDLFKSFNLTGEFEFKGFDSGTSWYQVLVTGEILFRYFIGCLGVALCIVQLKKTYYESESARLNYLASINEDVTPVDADQKKHSDRFVKVSLEDGVGKVIHNVKDTNGKTAPEITSELVMATTRLVKELDEGTEFHLSLNPPDYAKEEAGRLEIDYKSMPAIEKSKEIKQLESPVEPENSSPDEK